jgi:hypothetical protein
MTPFESLVESLAVSGITDQETILSEAARRNVAVDAPVVDAPVVDAPVVDAPVVDVEEKAAE